MRVLCLAAALASACAFTTQPASFTTQTPLVGERVSDNVIATGGAHRTRRATIVMDGKANGESYVHFLRREHVRMNREHIRTTRTLRRGSLTMDFESYSRNLDHRSLKGPMSC